MLQHAKRVERLYEDLSKQPGVPREALKHIWEAALALRAKHHPDHEPEVKAASANGEHLVLPVRPEVS